MVDFIWMALYFHKNQ